MREKIETRGASTLPANISDTLAGLQNMQNVARNDGSAGRGSFMKFAKGKYFYGTDNVEPQEGSFWAVDINSFVHGYQAWGNNKILGEVVSPMRGDPVIKSQLERHEYTDKETQKELVADWKAYRGFILVCTNGEDKGIQCFLSACTVGMVNAINELIQEVVAAVTKDPSTPVPIIELSAGGYTHKTWGFTHTPEFNIVDWVGLDATETNLDSASEGESEGESPLYDASADGGSGDEGDPGDAGDEGNSGGLTDAELESLETAEADLSKEAAAKEVKALVAKETAKRTRGRAKADAETPAETPAEPTRQRRRRAAS